MKQLTPEYLIDTNVLSELFKKNPHQSVLEWIKSQKHLYLSAITVEEIWYGLIYLKNKRYLELFNNLLKNHSTIFAVNEQMAIKAGEFRGHHKMKGSTRTQSDMLIASTAYLHDLVLVTRNVKDFTHCEIKIHNPF